MSNTEENFQIQKRVSWEQTPPLPTTKTLNTATPHSCLHLFLLARTARPLGLGLGLTARAYPVCPGPRPSLTLQLRSHPSMVASQDSRSSSFLRQKQRVQRLSRDTFTESSASGLSTLPLGGRTQKPLPARA